MMYKIKRSIATLYYRWKAGGIPSYFVTDKPSRQAPIDIFKGDWASMFPKQLELSAGQHKLFEDPRIHSFIEWLPNGIKDMEVLELGPLEGAHTAMLEQSGAKSITSIEANSRAYLKCLITKEVLGLKASRFELGDIYEYMRSTENKFDIGIACGIIYHLKNPHEIFDLLSHCIEGHLYIWTHCWDASIQETHPDIWKNFTTIRDVQLSPETSIRLHKHEYGATFFTSGFWGGNSTYSEWMEKDDLIKAAEHFGFEAKRIESIKHHNGPSIAICFSKR